MTMDDASFRDLAIRHVLEGLEGDDLAAFREELARRGDAGRREVERLRGTVASVAYGADPVEPPDELRDRVLSDVAAMKRAAADEEDRVGAGGGAVPPKGPSATSGGGPGRRFPWRLAAAAALLAAVGLGIWGLDLRDELRVAQSRADSLSALAARADSVQQALVELRRDLTTVASPRTSVRTLAGTDQQPDARARVFVDPETGRALLFAFELPILSEDEVYQLWAIRGDRPESLGTFTASEEGPARVELPSLEQVTGADALAVTIEPAPGQPSPTGPMVLQSRL